MENKSGFIKAFFEKINPALRAGLFVCFMTAVLTGSIQLAVMLHYYGIFVTVAGILVFLVLMLLLTCLLTLLFMAAKHLSWKIVAILVFSLAFCIALGTFSVYIMLFCLFCVPTVYLLYPVIHKEYRTLPKKSRYIRYGIAFLGLCFSLAILVFAFWPGYSLEKAGMPKQASLSLPDYHIDSRQFPDMQNPADAGDFESKRLYYAAAGQNIEPYPGREIIPSKTVDASALVGGYRSLRRFYYGFGPEKLPLNGQVWMPEGEGPFPLVLMVHGNHEAGDRSDGGYDYLGELLSSQGMIAVSVDENFLNSSVLFDFFMLKPLEDEIDARAYVLLEHLKLLYDWNSQENSTFYHKIDFEKLALAGHSRGGEACALAAAYAQMKVNPDNGMQKFDYPFAINTVIALSPTEGIHRPAQKELSLKDINYLVLQGAQDMDVTSFMGDDLFRMADPGENGIKAQVYIQNANHGQFNSVWGQRDTPVLWSFVNHHDMLITMEEQQEAAKVFASAFLNITLLGNTEYRSLFETFACGEEWLPPTLYTTDYISSDSTILADFDHTRFLESASMEGITFAAEGFSLWTEMPLPARSNTQYTNTNRVLTLGWREDTAIPPVFRIDLSRKKGILKEGTVLAMSLCAGNSSAENPVSFTIRLTDQDGTVSELPIESFGGVAEPLYSPLYKFPFSAVIGDSEPVLQAVNVPVDLFAGLHGDIIKIEFLFHTDGSDGKQRIYMDDIRVKDSNLVQ